MSDPKKVVYVHLIPVVNIETGEILEINRDDISQICSDKRGLIFQSKITGSQYRLVRNQDEIEEAWLQYGFHSFDNTNVTNLNHAKLYDEYSGKIYFEDVLTPNSLSSSVANIHSKYLKSLMGEYGIKSAEEVQEKEKEQEYKPTRLFAKPATQML